ncbi:SulP family inorganic anion transporter, partial [Kitasatospora sp. NPDC059571]|uniref:SulP family inorganic anion transporter n=1 Tax=Kitasatospora sp. NPDC059571 TaxID=3346871 RepID=UPI00368A08A4
TLAVLALWRPLPAAARTVPAPLAAVGLATAVTALAGLPVAKIEVKGLLGVVDPPGPADLSVLTGSAGIATVLAFTLIASAESLFSAAAVDRLHSGARTDYDRELIAQGAGNTLCGLLGALPMTAVIVRSAANVQAGARTKASRVLHGVWLLLFAALLPAALGVIPLAALAGVLVHAGAKLLPVSALLPLWRSHRGELLVLVATAVGIVLTNLFEGVLLGLLIAVLKTAWETSAVHLEVADGGDGPIRVAVTGNATFLRLPRILGTLESLPRDRPIELDLTGLRHLDHACRTALADWAARHNEQGVAPVSVPALH